MSTFKSFSTSSSSTPSVRFFLNISRKESTKDTIIGYTHNGVIFASPSNDSAWIQFRAVSDKQGWTPMEIHHEGQVHTINPESFWLKLFMANDSTELPDIKLKINLGSIDDAITLHSHGGCFEVQVPINTFQLSEGEYKGIPIVYFSLNGTVTNVPTRGKQSVDASWIKQCLTESIQESACNGNTLSRFRKSPVTTAKTNSNPANNMATSSLDSDLDILLDL